MHYHVQAAEDNMVPSLHFYLFHIHLPTDYSVSTKVRKMPHIFHLLQDHADYSGHAVQNFDQ